MKRWYYTQNDALILILNSDFDYRNKKWKKNDIFFHSLLFLTLKCDFLTPTKPQFQPSSMSWKNVWVNILFGAAMIDRPDLDQSKKKTRQYDLSDES